LSEEEDLQINDVSVGGVTTGVVDVVVLVDDIVDEVLDIDDVEDIDEEMVVREELDRVEGKYCFATVSSMIPTLCWSASLDQVHQLLGVGILEELVPVLALALEWVGQVLGWLREEVLLVVAVERL
jgi:hypothetical protein